MGPKHATPLATRGVKSAAFCSPATWRVQRICRALMLPLLIAAASAAEAQTFTPIATKTATNTPSPTPTITPFISPTNTPTITSTPTITPTATNTPTPFFCCQCVGFCLAGPGVSQATCMNQGCPSVENGVCSNTSGMCSTVTPTFTPSNTRTITPTVTQTFTPTLTPTVTPTATVPMNVDPYKCYRIKGKTAFKSKTVTLVDQFDDDARMTVLLKPLYLCNPSGKGDVAGQNVSTMKNPGDHLVCYAIRDVTKPRLNPPQVTTRNQIVPEEINVEMFEVKKSKLLCLPSAKTVMTGPTSTPTLTPTRTPTGPTATPTSTPTT